MSAFFPRRLVSARISSFVFAKSQLSISATERLLSPVAIIPLCPLEDQAHKLCFRANVKESTANPYIPSAVSSSWTAARPSLIHWESPLYYQANSCSHHRELPYRKGYRSTHLHFISTFPCLMWHLYPSTWGWALSSPQVSNQKGHFMGLETQYPFFYETLQLASASVIDCVTIFIKCNIC